MYFFLMRRQTALLILAYELTRITVKITASNKKK